MDLEAEIWALRLGKEKKKIPLMCESIGCCCFGRKFHELVKQKGFLSG